MRRRLVEDVRDPVPSRLRGFDSGVWADLDEWREARREWDRLYGWPGGGVERIREERAVRLECMRGRGRE